MEYLNGSTERPGTTPTAPVAVPNAASTQHQSQDNPNGAETEIVVSPRPQTTGISTRESAFLPAMTLEVALARRAVIVEFVRRIMVRDQRSSATSSDWSRSLRPSSRSWTGPESSTKESFSAMRAIAAAWSAKDAWSGWARARAIHGRRSIATAGWRKSRFPSISTAPD